MSRTNNIDGVSSKLNIHYRFFKKLWISVLMPKFLWKIVISNYAKHYQDANYYNKLIRRIWLRMLPIWPRLRESGNWYGLTAEQKKFQPEIYDREVKGSIIAKEIVNRAKGKDLPIVELGCNCGFYLNYLAEYGYTNLTGVDLCGIALNYFKEKYSQTYAMCNVKNISFQEFLVKTETNRYHTLYTLGATVEIVNPTFPLVKEIARVTSNSVILYINEAYDIYPRFWEYEFAKYGFVMTKLLRPVNVYTSNDDNTGFGSSLIVFKKQYADK